MPRRTRQPKISPKQHYGKLEQQLVLLAYMNHLLGYNRNRDLLHDVMQAGEGFDSNRRSNTFHRINSREDLKIKSRTLGRYDGNIHTHLDKINARRSQPITLRYFQYLALLYTEIFLDNYFNKPKKFVKELNNFILDYGSRNYFTLPFRNFQLSDLKKLAYWMATGSGKTLIMHLNYHQFLHYHNDKLNAILLITPNEGLSEQHIEELNISGIPCRRFNLNNSGSLMDRNLVEVIEITKLVKEKRGRGVSIPLEAFEGNDPNLIFVDEGHKGSGGEAWRYARDTLGATGFTFEYSATFGQALSAAQRDELTVEYAKVIVFDYSYKYFYGDGYGKDFQVLNLREETYEDKTDELLLANLLSFYEQLRFYQDSGKSISEYNIEKPLWIFVGSSVNAVYTERKRKRSDVLTIARFLNRFLRNEANWSVQTIDRLLTGKSSFNDPTLKDKDLFEKKFDYIRKMPAAPNQIYHQILKSIFHTDQSGNLHLGFLRGKSGEIGLKVSVSKQYFGLIYIGDTSAFRKLAIADESEIQIDDDAISDSLFERISDRNSPLSILIGAKKFMEGWNSWRVSNMGLLNIGRSEGSQIIQLFGRGVRLKGKDISLKRSEALEGKHPQYLSKLETLNIFAVRANYMNQFKDYLEREGIETEGYVDINLPIRSNEDFLNKGLLITRLPNDKVFEEEKFLTLKPDRQIKVKVDYSLDIKSLTSDRKGLKEQDVTTGKELRIPEEVIHQINWDEVYLDLTAFKAQKKYYNLIFEPLTLREILSNPNGELYTLIGDESLIEFSVIKGNFLLQEVITSILRKYMERYFTYYKNKWQDAHIRYIPLSKEDSNFQDYQIQIPRSKKILIEKVLKLIDEGEKLYGKKRVLDQLPNIHFDRHLFQPLLEKPLEGIILEPEGLVKSEYQFVFNLKIFFENEKQFLRGKEIFLLRNLGRGKGVGFYGEQGVYPDFILWIKYKTKQKIVFIEPHGMLHENIPLKSEKVKLHERLNELSRELSSEPEFKNVSLHSYILSFTPYDTLRLRYGEDWTQEEFEARHILFFDNQYDYIRKLFK